MEIKVYGEEKKEVVQLKLEQEGDKVKVIVVDEDGHALNTLLDIDEDGVYLWAHVSDDLGFSTDSVGRLELR